MQVVGEIENDREELGASLMDHEPTTNTACVCVRAACAREESEQEEERAGNMAKSN